MDYDLKAAMVEEAWEPALTFASPGDMTLGRLASVQPPRFALTVGKDETPTSDAHFCPARSLPGGHSSVGVKMGVFWRHARPF